jgi:hypothetical protein
MPINIMEDAIEFLNNVIKDSKVSDPAVLEKANKIIDTFKKDKNIVFAINELGKIGISFNQFEFKDGSFKKLSAKYSFEVTLERIAVPTQKINTPYGIKNITLGGTDGIHIDNGDIDTDKEINSLFTALMHEPENYGMRNTLEKYSPGEKVKVLFLTKADFKIEENGFISFVGVKEKFNPQAPDFIKKIEEAPSDTCHDLNVFQHFISSLKAKRMSDEEILSKIEFNFDVWNFRENTEYKNSEKLNDYHVVFRSYSMKAEESINKKVAEEYFKKQQELKTYNIEDVPEAVRAILSIAGEESSVTYLNNLTNYSKKCAWFNSAGNIFDIAFPIDILSPGNAPIFVSNRFIAAINPSTPDKTNNYFVSDPSSADIILQIMESQPETKSNCYNTSKEGSVTNTTYGVVPGTSFATPIVTAYFVDFLLNLTPQAKEEIKNGLANSPILPPKIKSTIKHR